MPSTWLYLIRHGEVKQAAEGRFFGHTDVPLSAIGVAQVEALARQLAGEPIEAVYASDLLRARQSAAPLAAARGVTPLVVAALREVAMGRWEGLTFQEMRAREPEVVARWLADPVTIRFPGGESFGDLRDRVMPALRELLVRHVGGRVAVVAHGGSNRVILADALGLALGNALGLAQDYGGMNLIEYREHVALVHVVNRQIAGVAGAPAVETTARG